MLLDCRCGAVEVVEDGARQAALVTASARTRKVVKWGRRLGIVGRGRGGCQGRRRRLEARDIYVVKAGQLILGQRARL